MPRPASRRRARPPTRLDTVVLRFGETLDEVARARGVAPRELRRLNGVKDSGRAARRRDHPGAQRGAAAEAGPRKARRRARREPRRETTGPARGGGRGRRRSSSRSPIACSATRGASASSTGRATATALDEIAEAFGVRADELIGVEQPRRAAPSCTRAWCCRSSCARTSIPAGVLLLDPAQGAGGDARLGGVPRARDGAPGEEAPHV